MLISIKKVKKILLKAFLILQLTISLIFLMQYITMSAKQKELESITKNILKTENIFSLKITPGPAREKTIDTNSINNLYNDLYNDNTLMTSTFDISDVVISEESKKIECNYDNYLKQNFNPKDFNYSNSYNSVLYVDENYSKVFGFKVSEGVQLEFGNINFENDIIPVLAGQSYKQAYKINDLIKTDNKILKIVGFLEKGQCFISDSQSLFFRNIFLDNYLVIPRRFEDEKNLNMKIQYFGECIIKYSETSQKDEIQARAEGYLEGNNIEGRVMAYSETKWEYLDALGIPKPYEMLVYVTITICSILGISIMLILNILYKKNEIGIKLAVGYSKLRIFYSLLIESGIIIIISYLITLLYYKTFDIKIKYLIEVGFQNSTILLYICLALLIITNIVPARFLMKATPKDLIGGLR